MLIALNIIIINELDATGTGTWKNILWIFDCVSNILIMFSDLKIQKVLHFVNRFVRPLKALCRMLLLITNNLLVIC